MIIDGHIHFDTLNAHDRLVADMDRNGIGPFCALVVGVHRSGPGTCKMAQALWLKHKHPDRVFVFGGVDYTGMFDQGRDRPDIPFVEQVRTLMELGCDGVKLLSGKPDVRKWVGHPLDGPAYEPMLKLLEDTQFPLLWHVGDPPEFWNKDAVPPWAKSRGWWYDNTHPPKAQIDCEIAEALRRHPKLNLVLAHFFFLSDRLADAAELLGKYPKLRIDLAPGVEMYHNFTANWEATREFFIRHADRIVFGTDTGLMENTNSPDRPMMVRKFLETSETYPVPEDPCMTPDVRPDLHGLGLPKEAVRKIEYENFVKFVGRDRPRALNMPLVREVLPELAKRARARGEEAPEAERVMAEIG